MVDFYDDNEASANETFGPQEHEEFAMTLIQGLKRYSFAFFFTVGIVGNTLNLFVLNRKGMSAVQTNTNRFLSAMALADLGFFLSMMTMSLHEYPWLISKMPWVLKNYVAVVWAVIPVVNFFSTASIWSVSFFFHFFSGFHMVVFL